MFFSSSCATATGGFDMPYAPGCPVVYISRIHRPPAWTALAVRWVDVDLIGVEVEEGVTRGGCCCWWGDGVCAPSSQITHSLS